MLGIAHNPSTRTTYKVILCLRMVTLALLGALVLAASAQAAAESPTAALTEAPNTSAASETVGGGAGSGGSTEGAGSTTGSEKMPETVSVSTPVVVENQPESTPAPGSGKTPSSAEGVGVPVKQPEVQVPEPSKIPAGTDGTEKESLSVAAGPEKTSEDPPPPTIVDTPVILTRSDLGYATPEIGYEAAPDVPAALINSPTDPPNGGALEAGAAEAAASVAAVAQISNAQRAGELSCELSSLSGDMSGNCSAEWLTPQRFLSGSPASYAAAVAALAPTSGPPGDGGRGGAAVGSPPVSPGPGPAPAGAAGSSAGATGLALSGFLTLAGLLLLGAPRAMRRLRLSCQPWRTACFVLIPERPG